MNTLSIVKSSRNIVNRPSLVPSSDAPLLLLVDDIPDNLKVLRGMLAPLGYRLTFATSGEQAIERARASQPDLILLDLMMPGMNGIETCRHLKETPETAEIPVMFLTASSDLNSLKRAFSQGAIDYVTKPFRSEELIARLKTHLELSGLRKQAQLRAKQEEILRELVADVHQSLDLDRILTSAVSNLQWLLAADRVSIAQRIASERPGAECRILASTDSSLQGESFTICPNPVRPAQFGLVRRCQREDDAGEREWFDHCQVTAEYRLPLFGASGLWGVIVVQRADRPLRVTEANLLEPVASQLALAIEHSELHVRLQVANTELMRLANIDGLTQIANRRALDKYLEQTWMRLGCDRKPLSAIMLDIDYFKRYNDTYGHVQGDRCLKKIALALQDLLHRPGDFIARYGGEEFCVVLPNTEIQGALECAHHLQQAIALLELEHSAHPDSSTVTVSIGIAAAIPAEASAPRTLLEAADGALYQAKASGRNCVVTAAGTLVTSQALNIEIGLRRSGQDRTLYRDLLEIFLEVHADFEMRFREAYESDDLDKPFYLVNTLRGGASNIGALALESATLSLEDALKQEARSPLHIDDLLVQVVEELRLVCQAIEAFSGQS